MVRILYGVQGTGNGHLTRARAMAKAFQQLPHVHIDFLISGRAQRNLFGVEPLGDFKWRQGLSFATRAGKVSVMDTVSSNPWWQFWRDVQTLDVTAYDLVITDFEPVTAWAAKRAKVPCIGLGRQYAFYHAHPSLNVSSLQRAMVRQFAPVDLALGTHWQPLTSTTLPPIVEPIAVPDMIPQLGHYLVYLPFEPLADIKTLLVHLNNLASEYHFDVFHPDARHLITPNAQFYPPSREGFKQAFAKAQGVIANAGFGTSSEALMTGKKILLKPLKGQFEQYANADYLAQHELAQVSTKLQSHEVLQWLRSDTSHQLSWPTVAEPLAEWLGNFKRCAIADFTAALWRDSSIQEISTARRVSA